MRKLICEFVGTMMLVLLACGVAVATDVHYLGTALAFGLVIVAMAYSIGNVSGCHINPAVSLGMAISGRMSWKEFFQYAVAQILGAIAGAALLGVIMRSFGALGANSYGGNSYNSSYNGTGYNATRPTLQPEDGKATAGIILSICSLVFCCLGVILAPIGMVLSKQAINAGNDSGKAKAGWICGIIGLVLNILFIVIYIVLIALGIANS